MSPSPRTAHRASRTAPLLGLTLSLLTAAAAMSVPEGGKRPAASGPRSDPDSKRLPRAAGLGPPLPGDCNGDRLIDGRDLCIILSGYGSRGFDPVAGGECPSWPEWDDRERQFRESIADIPMDPDQPPPRYPPMSGPIIRGDWDQSGRIDGADLSVVLGAFGIGH